MKTRFLLLTLLVGSLTAQARIFRNAYVSFELPPNWNCKLEGSEWVCENDFAGRTKEAIIILTAKEVGPNDRLDAYLAHLQTPRITTGRNGAQLKSQVINVKERMISNQIWIDALHLGSEVGPYFTRYLATIKEKIAIVVTFSAHKEHFTKYSGDFIRAIESLRVVATPDGSGSGGRPGGNGEPGQGETFGTPSANGPTPYIGGADNLPEEGGGARGKGSRSKWLILALILAAGGTYFYIREKRKRKRPPKGKR